jgi:hypothetical protein
MSWTKAERAAELAALVGITIDAAELNEVAERLDSLVRELETLGSLELSNVQPVTVFPDAGYDDA